MTAATAGVDRQQRLRDRIAEVQNDLVSADSAVDAASEASRKTAEKLDLQRKALQQAERSHTDATGRLKIAKADRDRIQGDLMTLRRRREMADLVRGARR